MSGRLQTAIRGHLRGTDGMTTAQLRALLDSDTPAVSTALRAMPDAYIDRWTTVPTGQDLKGQCLAAVWCVVDVPPHCPRPATKKEKRERTRANVEVG
jgi:hypothetical protein